MMNSDTLSVIKICKGRHSRHEEGLSHYEALKQHYIDALISIGANGNLVVVPEGADPIVNTASSAS